MTTAKVSSLTSPEVPIEVNSLEISADGYLIRRNKKIDRFSCSFLYEDFPINVIIEGANRLPVMTLSADLGFIPYTAESPESRKVFNMLLEHGERLPFGKIVKKEKQRISYDMELPINPPLTAKQIITHITSAILQAQPTLKLIKGILS